jgi:5-methylcytosine-specific restriction enzyme subunit McrC
MFVYAWNRLDLLDRFNSSAESAPSLVTLFASLLAEALERRKHRGISRGYVESQGEISAIRGRVDVVRSLISQSVKRGRVHCHFETYSVDTPRNRIIKTSVKRLVDSKAWDRSEFSCDIRGRLVHRLIEMHDVGTIPIRRDMFRAESVGRNDAEDGLILALCELLFLIWMPTMEEGGRRLLQPDRDKAALRAIFERFVWRFLEIQLTPHGWKVQHNKRLDWPIETKSEGLSKYLPSMELDIRLTSPDGERVIVVDTKFKNIVAKGQYVSRFVSANIYQIYTYVHSQVQTSDRANEAILLYPAIDRHISEFMQLPELRLRFETIDLMLPWRDIEAALLAMFR